MSVIFIHMKEVWAIIGILVYVIVCSIVVWKAVGMNNE